MEISIPSPGWRAVEKCHFPPVFATCLVPSSVHVKPFLKPNKVMQVRDFAYILLKNIPAQLDSFVAKINNVPAQSRGGGPEKGPAHGDLVTINPKISSIKQPSRQAFETRR